MLSPQQLRHFYFHFDMKLLEPRPTNAGFDGPLRGVGPQFEEGDGVVDQGPKAPPETHGTEHHLHHP